MLAAVKRSILKRDVQSLHNLSVVDKIPSKGDNIVSPERRHSSYGFGFRSHLSDDGTMKTETNSPPGSISGRFSPKRSPSDNSIELDCHTQVQADDIEPSMISQVVTSWETGILTIPKWYATVGETFLRKIFELDPETITMFGFSDDMRHDDPALSKDRSFMQKATRLIKAVDMAIGFLGPDLEPLQDSLFALGKRHVAMGCKPEHWPVVGKALLHSFESHMVGGFDDQLRESWTIIYNFLSYHMIQGLNAKYQIVEKEGIKVKKLHHPEPITADSQKVPIRSELVKLPPRPYLKSKNAQKKKEIDLKCIKNVHVSDITFNQVEIVASTWAKYIKSIPDWGKVTGELFLRNVLKRESKAAAMFGFPADTKYDDPALPQDRKFVMKGYTLIKAIDMAVGCLGPDLSALEKELFAVGKRHVLLDCRPSQWELVGWALFDVLEEYMGDVFTHDVKLAWSQMYRFWGFHMIKGLISVKPEWEGQ